MHKLIFPGRPVPAVRMTKRGKYIKHSAQRYLAYKTEIGYRARAIIKEPLEGPVAIDIVVYICGRAGDWDNYSKAICDGLNGIAYIDDEQIKDGHVAVREAATAGDQRAEVVVWGLADVAAG